MSHSVFLSNTSSPSGTEGNDILMMEWGYEMPLLLQPLLVSGGIIENNILYYEAQPGIENLKRFYLFLEATPSLIQNTSIFTECKNRLFEYIDGLDLAYFSVDAREVFKTEERPIDEQAAIWLADIAYNNAMITSAMERNDISLLAYNQFKHVSMAFQSFAELLNYPDYHYGLEYIYEEPVTEEIYNEHGLWGLKSAEGVILLPPQFDEFYEFSEQGIAVVMKGQKYGYVHRSGEIIALPEWDEAYDFDYANVAIVQRNGLLGLIDLSGKVVVEPKYESLHKAGYNGQYIAQKNGSWGILATDGQMIVDFKYDQIELLHENVFMFQKDGIYSLAEDGEEFDLIVRKVPPQGFAWAFKGKEVYLIDKYGISRANKSLVQQETDSSFYDEVVRARLLTYAQLPDEERATDAYTPVEELYNIGVDAYNRQDYPSAIYHYTLSAEKGYGYAMNNLAYVYYMVDGYIDNDKAFYWYEKGAAAGNTNAINGLSLCYQYGIGIAPDMERAIDLLLQAAEDGMAAAHNNLGYLLWENDPEQALYHYKKAEALGEADYGGMAYVYERKGELEAAIGYFQKAIDNRDDSGHIELAKIYMSAEGFIDQEKARKHIAAAEKAGIEIPEELLG
jgi:hypothetical protein